MLGFGVQMNCVSNVHLPPGNSATDVFWYRHWGASLDLYIAARRQAARDPCSQLKYECPVLSLHVSLLESVTVLNLLKIRLK